LPVIADERVRGEVSIGGGDHGVSLTVSGEALIDVLEATIGDVTSVEERISPQRPSR
jgi:hypothetical protein